jgi:hypothetical protein
MQYSAKNECNESRKRLFGNFDLSDQKSKNMQHAMCGLSSKPQAKCLDLSSNAIMKPNLFVE